MQVAILQESHPGERRVAASPDSVIKLIKLGFSVAVEAGAGEGACFTDAAFVAAGATIATDVRALLQSADVVLKVRPLHTRPDGLHEVKEIKAGATVISFVWPVKAQDLIADLNAHQITQLAMDCVPRISRAQKMDALSSMANIAGYRAVIEAAHHFGSFFCGQMTAAGKVAPAKILVIGAGVAGLAALGAGKGLGAIVRAFDTRPAVREQVQSMGAEFIEVELKEDGEGQGGYAKEMSPEFIAAEMALFRKQAKEVDIVITTALIPGRPAPKLWLADMVEMMKPGSVIVDLAAESGGNCELTVQDEVVVRHGVTIIGRTDLTSRLATTSSALYANNLVHLLTDMGGAEKFKIDLNDEVVRGALVTYAGDTLWPPPKMPQLATPVVIPSLVPPPVKHASHRGSHEPAGSARQAPMTWVMVFVLVTAWLALHFVAGNSMQDPSAATAIFIERLTVFVLACFVGWQVVWNVTPALHTPLMSVTNAISGIILLGGMLHTSGHITQAPAMLGIVAVLLATINVSGGFLVTRRMLKMFHK